MTFYGPAKGLQLFTPVCTGLKISISAEAVVSRAWSQIETREEMMRRGKKEKRNDAKLLTAVAHAALE
jgi:hypothetical protein